MATVAAGSRLLVHGERVPLSLRSLRAVELAGGWSVPVMGDAAALQAAGLLSGAAVVEFPTDHGPVRLDAELIRTDGRFVLRAPGLRTAAMVEQRRENVRGVVQLPLRGSVLAAASDPTRSAARSQSGPKARPRTFSQQSGPAAPDDGVSVILEGFTETVSGGGISAELTGATGFSPGTKIYVELRMPSGDLAPAVMTVLEHEGSKVRARFSDISALDRERLVRLVFTKQRVDLAERRKVDDPRS
jgi:PilZ domain